MASATAAVRDRPKTLRGKYRTPEKEKQSRDWSDCGQVNYGDDGTSWGVTSELATIYLGKRTEVEEILRTGIIPATITGKKRETLDWILKFRRENLESGAGDRLTDLHTPGTIKERDFGKRPLPGIKHKPENFKRSAGKQTLPSNFAKPKQQMLLGG